MAHTRDDVLAAIAAGFPKSARARVLDLLDTYGVNPYEREVARVQLAILTLSEKDEEKLREFTSVAKIDYRDVLFWAEHPEEAIHVCVRDGVVGITAESAACPRQCVLGGEALDQRGDQPVAEPADRFAFDREPLIERERARQMKSLAQLAGEQLNVAQ